MAGSNWQQLAGGSVNPYDVLRDDGTPTADYGQHVICDGGTVTLPSPKANEAVLVSNIFQDTTVTTSTGLVEKGSDVTHGSDVSDPVLFVSDGSDWYVANNLNYLRTIPDSVVSRDPDDSSSTNNNKLGVEISISQDWPSIGCKISSNASGFTTGYIYDSDENLIKDVDISSLSSGDTFTFDDVNLTAGNNYIIVIDADGSDYTFGFDDNPSFPYSSSGGNLEIVAGGQIGGSTPDALNIIEVGNVGFA